MLCARRVKVEHRRRGMLGGCLILTMGALSLAVSVAIFSRRGLQGGGGREYSRTQLGSLRQLCRFFRLQPLPLPISSSMALT